MRLGLSLWRFLAAAVLVTALVDAQSYDAIVVGSGPGGLVAAEYLSRDPTVSVLILEAGLPSLKATGGTDTPDYAVSQGYTKFDIPGEFDNTIYNSANDKYRVDWISGPYMWLGKLVGGCSSINAALYFRTPDSYVTNMKWPFSPSRVASLMDENEQIHGHTDKPSADGNWYLQEGYNIVANAFRSAGYSEKTINDVAARNAKSKTFGHAPYSIKNGFRDTPANAFWNAMKARSNVKLVTSAMVSYIKHTNGKATGVVYNNNVQVSLTSRGAILMAAGVLSTPKVLIQSGIGPSDQLSMLQSNSNFPGVQQTANGGWAVNNNIGKSIFDTNVVFASFSHPNMVSFQYKNKPSSAINQYMYQGQTGGWASPGPTLIGYETYTVNGRSYDFQTTVLTAGFGDFYQNSNAFTTSLYINNPESRDYASFSSDGAWHGLTANTAYMSTPNDLAALQSYATKIVNLMQANGATFLSASNGQSVNDWVNANRGLITHHFGGSCYASSDSSDSKRCADDKLRVIGTSNVFVADASAMKEGTVNPYGFVMYVGREAASQVQDYLSSTVTPTPTPTTGSCSIQEGVDYIGNDVANALSSTAEGCCSICQANSACHAYSWSNYNGGTCWLKSGKGSTANTAGVRSAVVSTTTPTPTPTPTTTPTPTPTSTPSTCSIENNVDYIGNDLTSKTSAAAEGCCSICLTTNGCNAFSWTSYSGGTCWLKTAKGSTASTTGVRSALVTGTCNLVSNVDYYGNDISNTLSSTASGCCPICRATSGCKAFTWTSQSGGTCWLKSAKGTANNLAGAVGGTI